MNLIKSYELTHIRTLRKLAMNLDNGLRCKHAALLTSGNKTISIGVNKSKSDPFQKINSRSHKLGSTYQEYSWIHAEVDCLKDVSTDFRKSTLFVIRADSKGNLMESCPCEGCNALIIKSGIRRVVHSNSEGGISVINHGI